MPIRKRHKKGGKKLSKKLFSQYYARLAKEGILRSLICALIVGLSALTAFAIVYFFTEFVPAWVGFIVLGVVTAAATPLFYFAKFRPSKREVAMRIDALGLEERLLTMTQYENDNSYIAIRQREDAKAALNRVNAKLIKFAVSLPLVITLACLAPIGAGASVAAMLIENRVIPSIKEEIEDSQLPDPIFWDVEFVIEGDGEFDGDEFQRVEDGKLITEVFAIPAEGWYLEHWTWEVIEENGVVQPYVLQGTNVFYIEEMYVHQNYVITAVFAEAQEGDGEGEGEGEGEEQEEGNEESDDNEPKDSESGEQNNEEGENEEQPPSDSPGGDAAGGKYQPNHGIIDGNTDYGDVHENAQEDAMEEMGQNDEIPGDIKDIVKDYFDNIEK